MLEHVSLYACIGMVLLEHALGIMLNADLLVLHIDTHMHFKALL